MIMESNNKRSPIAGLYQIFFRPTDLSNQKLEILRNRGFFDHSVEDVAMRLPEWLWMVIVLGACAICYLFLWTIFA